LEDGRISAKSIPE